MNELPSLSPRYPSISVGPATHISPLILAGRIFPSSSIILKLIPRSGSPIEVFCFSPFKFTQHTVTVSVNPYPSVSSASPPKLLTLVSNSSFNSADNLSPPTNICSSENSFLKSLSLKSNNFLNKIGTPAHIVAFLLCVTLIISLGVNLGISIISNPWESMACMHTPNPKP